MKEEPLYEMILFTDPFVQGSNMHVLPFISFSQFTYD